MRGYISEELVTKETGLCSATQHFSYERMHERNKFPLPVDPDATRFFLQKKRLLPVSAAYDKHYPTTGTIRESSVYLCVPENTVHR